jgi:hypothetical protein
MKTQGCSDFAWQKGYGAFSVSQSALEPVRDCVETQEDHHQRFDFKAEFRSLLELHDVEYDERYVWD